MTAVSFLVPTLNRNPLVLRAVASCLAALDHSRRAGGVVVLDSESDDGSWEALHERFGSEPRVYLRQNKRGLGPTRSWLDAAEGIAGETVTFVWSDDYIAADFLDRLLPPIEQGAPLAIGYGAVRPAECEKPFESNPRISRLPAHEVLSHYLRKSNPPGIDLGLSPTTALFPRGAFDEWRAKVETISNAGPLAHHFMWRRAIGPDLLLFLIALGRDLAAPVPYVHQPIAQLSSHEGSITVSSSPWVLTMGYWLARSAFLRRLETPDRLPGFGQLLGEAVLQGEVLARRAQAPVGDLHDEVAVRSAIRAEVTALRQRARDDAGFGSLAAGVARGLYARVASKL